MSSRRVSPGQQAVRGMKKTSPGGDTPVAQGPGTNNEGPGLSGLQPEMIVETSERVPSKGGHAPTAASEDSEAPDILTNMLQQASVEGVLD